MMGVGNQAGEEKISSFRLAERIIPFDGMIEYNGLMARTETIRGLERGLQVLQALQSIPIASLHDIHLATGISKPSLLRILNTLEQFGTVSRRLADGHYRISAFGRAARKRDRHDRVAEAAAPVLDRLCQKVSWPSDLFVPAGDHMERRETSRPQSPFSHPGYMNNLIGQPVNWLMTGVGRIYLAYCPDREREDILQRLRKSDQPEDRLARDQRQVEKILAETRAQGYGTRAPNFPGGGYGNPRDDGLAGIAVPLQDGARVHGSINILWVRTAMTIEQCAARYLTDLQRAATEIVESLHRPPRRPAAQ
jgi:IclR family transcriptional regulator, mhp operon transcriptional activator